MLDLPARLFRFGGTYRGVEDHESLLKNQISDSTPLAHIPTKNNQALECSRKGTRQLMIGDALYLVQLLEGPASASWSTVFLNVESLGSKCDSAGTLIHPTWGVEKRGEASPPETSPQTRKERNLNSARDDVCKTCQISIKAKL